MKNPLFAISNKKYLPLASTPPSYTTVEGGAQ
jgi:hypothetical protein